ncbi:GNAT family N-acetyltransferase [Actinoplanes sp. N902-109]|uniref:GNAT family N-acetyltransferase n=1 Tax=Actinoplanes sp. (strain N902-109) TaxID=649831 RepID=UPI0006841F4E|nr:GNAT family N-acetyltransferase [Actinoplanes sp. N902-109]
METDETQPVVRLVPLSPAVLRALTDGDLGAARDGAGVALTEWFASADLTWLWRLRLDQIAGDPSAAGWVANAAVTVPDGVVVATGAYHGPPDEAGMVELSYSVDPLYRRRGYARAVVRELLRRAADEPAVVTVRASISPDNTASLATIAPFGFTHVGEQWDEEDGTELLYERPAGTLGTAGGAQEVGGHLGG